VYNEIENAINAKFKGKCDKCEIIAENAKKLAKLRLKCDKGSEIKAKMYQSQRNCKNQ